MDGYSERMWTETISRVTVGQGDTGEADLSIELDAGTGQHRVEISSRVSREDLPKLVLELYALVSADLRPTLLDALKGQG